MALDGYLGVSGPLSVAASVSGNAPVEVSVPVDDPVLRLAELPLTGRITTTMSIPFTRAATATGALGYVNLIRGSAFDSG